ncbi:protein tantalus [Malaya genurostris]|uniref:protein tantalus n=1 Tax=Malaya genurostris TaxID=325434 RepID=UPI0026F3B240|nr:protein tantalus [Malaya genurostris]
MDKIPSQLLASIESNAQPPLIFNSNIENDLPLIMAALEQNLNFKEEHSDSRRDSEDNATDDEDEDSPGCNSSPSNRVQRRRSLRSKSVDSKLHKIKRRTITKPSRLPINLNASENEIRNYYMINTKRVDLKPTNLETIFEEGSPSVAKAKFFGIRKVRRSLNCCDGFNVNKTTTKARKNRVRKLLGGGPKLTKMTMDTFLERLKSMQNDSDDDTGPAADPRLNQTV